MLVPIEMMMLASIIFTSIEANIVTYNIVAMFKARNKSSSFPTEKSHIAIDIVINIMISVINIIMNVINIIMNVIS